MLGTKNLFSCIVLTFVATVTAKGYYSIVSPGTVHSNSKYNVAVAVDEVNEPCKVQLVLKGPDFEQTQEVDVQSLEMKNVEFVVPNVGAGSYELIATGVSGLIFSNKTELLYSDSSHNAYIQTDKATYKPGDLLQFRLILLDDAGKPAQVRKPISVQIKDTEKNLLKVFSNITLTKGVFSGNLQLSDFPILGSWEIQVLVDNARAVSKSFNVDKYVLPKFEVQIDVPPKVAAADEKFGFTIKAKYTFGKLVRGKATILIKTHSRSSSASSNFVYYSTPIVERLRRRQPPYTYGGDYLPPPEYTPFQTLPSYATSTLHIVDKTMDIYGKAYLEFDMADIKSFNAQNNAHVSITVVVTEEITGLKHNATAETELVPYSYIISTSANAPISCGESKNQFNFYVTVLDLANHPVEDSKNPVTLSYKKPDIETETHLNAYLNKSGVATIELVCSNLQSYGQSILVQYKEQTVPTYISFSSLVASYKFVGATVLTKNPQVGEDVEIEITTKELLKHFWYAIVSNGNIVDSGSVQLPNEVRKHTFKVNARSEMVPVAKVLVYYVHEEDLKFYETTFNIKREFVNRISIKAPRETKPGEKIHIQVNTYPDSYVGLMGVDQSVLLLKSGNDFDGTSILSDLYKKSTSTPPKYLNTIDPYPGTHAGLVIMTNAHFFSRKIQMYQYHSPGYAQFDDSRTRFPGGMSSTFAYNIPTAAMGGSYPGSMRTVQQVKPVPRVRKQFVENWFFDDFASSGKDGISITKIVPDTITSWVVTGFSLSPQLGFALTDTPTTIQTFRPFFISLNLPYSVKRGESVSIPVNVFNYMNENVGAVVTLYNEEREFVFDDNEKDEEKRVQHVKVTSNDAETVTFVIRPHRIGHITLKITAISGLAGDAVHKELRVEPEGVTIFKNRDYYIQNSEANSFESVITLDISEDLVPASENIEISVMGDILSSSVQNLNELVRMPHGCGEQNMVNFVPNILVMRYLESVGQHNSSIEAKAKRFMEIGYQRELNYKHSDGSYSAFGKSDPAGSTWLTAYVLRSFHQAAKYIDVDVNLLESGLSFLASKQAASGSFVEHGKVLDFSHLNDVGLSAFVLLAFLENTEYLKKYNDVIDRGLKYLQEHISETNDLYAISVAVYTLELYKFSGVEHILSELNHKAKVSEGWQWWSKSAETVTDTRQWWRPKSHDVEITGYILMTLLERNEPVLPVAKWLIAQRNSNGGFASTQETVVGMQALTKFAEKYSMGNMNMTIEYTAKEDTTSAGHFELNKENSISKQTAKLNNAVREISVKAKGKGVAILQVSYQYNVLEKEKKPSFTLIVTPRNNTEYGKLSMDVCTEFIPLPDESTKNIDKSNMVVMEVTLPSGFTAAANSFDKIRKVENVKLVETKKSDTNIAIYFDGLTASHTSCVPIEADRSHIVTDQKPVPVVIYDYYDSHKRATEFYKPPL